MVVITQREVDVDSFGVLFYSYNDSKIAICNAKCFKFNECCLKVVSKRFIKTNNSLSISK